MRRKVLAAIAVAIWTCGVGLRMGYAQEDVADISSQDLRAGGDANKRYFLIGPKEGAAEPREGYGLVVVMPGGDGSADFHPFVKRIYKHALGDDYLVAQPVAVKWTRTQGIVWPTKRDRVLKKEFSTEEFVKAVVKDVREKYKVDERHVFTLTWSSSGPAAYAVSLEEEKSVRGSFIAMSVFKPQGLPPLSLAKGHAYFLYHSPDDKTCPFRMAEEAKNKLAAEGAKVKLATYAGGHGWRGNVYGDIGRGIKWLEGAVEAASVEAEAPSPPAGAGGVLLSDGFETGRVSPDGWERGMAVTGVQYLWDKREASEGNASLCLKKNVKKYFPIAGWNRTMPYAGGARGVSVSVQVKAEKVTKAVVDLQFLDAKGEWIKHECAAYIGAKEDGEAPADHDWKEYARTVEVPEGTEAIRVALQIYGPGSVWFDALKISYVESGGRGR